jgi:hypothetical protein
LHAAGQRSFARSGGRRGVVGSLPPTRAGFIPIEAKANFSRPITHNTGLARAEARVVPKDAGLFRPKRAWWCRMARCWRTHIDDYGVGHRTVDTVRRRAG